jgi:hypothetical protein
MSEYEKIDNQFPKARFIIHIKLDELDKVIIDKDIAFIKYDACCYYQNKPLTKIYMCKNPSGNITVRDLINCLIKNRFKTNCGHVFLEQFTIDNDSTIVPFFGS